MTENTLAAEAAQADEVATSPAPEIVTEDQAAPGTEATEPPAETGEEKPIGDDKRRNRRTRDERIAQLVRQKREVEAEVERLKAQTAKPPKEDDFTDYAEYERARARHAAREALAEDRTETARAHDQQISQAMQADWQAGVAEFKARAPDFDAVVYRDDVPINAAMAQALMAMEDGPALAYHLGKNPREASRLASLSPMSAAAEMGRIAERLKAPPRRVVSSAPPPVAPITGSAGNPNDDPSKMSQAQYNAWRRAGR